MSNSSDGSRPVPVLDLVGAIRLDPEALPEERVFAVSLEITFDEVGIPRYRILRPDVDAPAFRIVPAE